MTGQDLQNIQTEAFGNNLSGLSVGEIISNTLPFIFAAAGIGLLVFLVLGGFQLMTSKGDPKAIEGAKGKITNALIGFFIVIFAYFIVSLIGQILGVEVLPAMFGGINR